MIDRDQFYVSTYCAVLNAALKCDVRMDTAMEYAKEVADAVMVQHRMTPPDLPPAPFIPASSNPNEVEKE